MCRVVENGFSIGANAPDDIAILREELLEGLQTQT
jgi:sRNA-binding carbon storage regulator CsrA